MSRDAAKTRPPPRTLAGIESVLGELNLADRFTDMLFRIASNAGIEDVEYLLHNVGVKVAWALQREVKRAVQPWDRRWNWTPDDRIGIGREITERSVQLPITKILISMRIEQDIAATLNEIQDRTFDSIRSRIDLFHVGDILTAMWLVRSSQLHHMTRKRLVGRLRACLSASWAILTLTRRKFFN